MRKELSTPAILFKGSGWAKKDAQAASRSASAGGAKEAGDSTREAAAAPGGGDSTQEAGGGAKDMSTSGTKEGKPEGSATAAAGKPAATTTRD